MDDLDMFYVKLVFGMALFVSVPLIIILIIIAVLTA